MLYNDVKIDQVAERAGVSKATISRYLNGKFQYMSQETKEKIRVVIADLGYRPSNIARSLKADKSGLLGCVVSDITNPFSMEKEYISLISIDSSLARALRIRRATSILMCEADSLKPPPVMIRSSMLILSAYG